MAANLDKLEVRDVVRIIDKGDVDFLLVGHKYLIREIYIPKSYTARTIRIVTLDGTTNLDHSGQFDVCATIRPPIVEVIGFYFGFISTKTSFETNLCNCHYLSNKYCHCFACDGGYDHLTDMVELKSLQSRLKTVEETNEGQQELSLEQRRGTCSCANPMCTGPHSFFHQV